MMNEFRYPSGINTAKSFTTTSDISAANVTSSATGTFSAVANSGAETIGGTLTVTGVSTFGATGQFNGSIGVTGNATIAGTLAVTGAVNFQSPFGVGNAGIKVGSLSGNTNPTGTTGGIGCLFINSSSGATGVTNRIYINTDGATGWTYIQTGA